MTTTKTVSTPPLRATVPVSRGYDYGPLRTYDVLWVTGRRERVRAHQVSWPCRDTSRPKVEFHASVNGRWTLLLSASQEDVRTIRYRGVDGETRWTRLLRRWSS